MLISECGIDLAVEGKPHQGGRGHWSRGHILPAAAVSPCSIRGRSTAIFLMDYEGRKWETFDIRRWRGTGSSGVEMATGSGSRARADAL